MRVSLQTIITNYVTGERDAGTYSGKSVGWSHRHIARKHGDSHHDHGHCTHTQSYLQSQ